MTCLWFPIKSFPETENAKLEEEGMYSGIAAE
jgi:hypothetical protein